MPLARETPLSVNPGAVGSGAAIPDRSTPGPVGVTRIAQDTWRTLFMRFCARLVDGKILDNGWFRPVDFQGQESISSPFEYTVKLHANTDTDATPDIDFSQIIGQPATVGIALPPTKTTGKGTLDDNFQRALQGAMDSGFSVFNGIVASFGMSEPGVYNATLRPALWKLTLTNRYHVHPQCNIRDAIVRVLKQHRIDYSMSALEDANNPAMRRDNPALNRVQDWLQAGESDYDFIHRLMSRAQLYYYFVHTGQTHTVVFANRPYYPPVYPDGRVMRYTDSGADPLGMEQEDTITRYQYQQTLTSSGVNARFTRQEAAWEKDTVATHQNYPRQSNGTASGASGEVPYGESGGESGGGELPFQYYKIYQYGLSREEVDVHANDQSAMLSTSATSFSGESHSAQFRTGHTFTTARTPNDAFPWVRPSLEQCNFVITQVKHQANLDGHYQNTFEATEASGLVTPFSLQGTHQGSLLAKVVGHQQPENWRYYQKTNFDPKRSAVQDRSATPEQQITKGVLVEFSTPGSGAEPVWIKLAPHMQTVPEVGVTVLISRANDASELPEIQSIIQNNGAKTATPSRWTANTQVGNGYSTSYADNKSVRFGQYSVADLNAAVALIEGQYASGKFKDVSYSQGAGYSYSTSENGRDGLLNTSESYGNGYSHSEGAENQSYTDIDHIRSESHHKNTENYTTISGRSYSKSTIGHSENSNTVGSSKSTSTTGSEVRTSTTGAVTNSSATGASNSNDVVGASNSNRTTGVSVSSEAIGMSTHSSATGMSNSNSVTGIANNNSAVGMSVENSAAGMRTSNSLVGMSSNDSTTGVSSGLSLVGMNSDNNTVGVSSRISTTGTSTNINTAGVSVDISTVGASTNINTTGTTMSINTHGPGVSLEFGPALITNKQEGLSCQMLCIILVVM